MRMPGQALHHLVIVRRRLQAGTRGELSDRAAIDLLPGRLVLQRGRRVGLAARGDLRSEENTSELQSLMRISYAVFCLKKQINTKPTRPNYAAKSARTRKTTHIRTNTT